MSFKSLTQTLGYVGILLGGVYALLRGNYVLPDQTLDFAVATAFGILTILFLVGMVRAANNKPLFWEQTFLFLVGGVTSFALFTDPIRLTSLGYATPIGVLLALGSTIVVVAAARR